MSFICAGVFWALDSAAKRHDPRLAALVISFAAFNVANISIFTTLFSGGLALLMLCLYLVPPRDAGLIPLQAAHRRLTDGCGGTVPSPG
jgi:hypothetical protein